MFVRFAMLVHVFGVLTCLVVMAEGESCVRNLRIVNTTDTSVVVSWDYDCKEGELRVSVRYKHEEHLGCRNMTHLAKDRISKGQVQVKNRTQIELQHLNPFSKYLIQVEDLSVRDSSTVSSAARDSSTVSTAARDSSTVSIVATTKSATPDVAPDSSTTQYDYKTTRSRLHFNWRAPRRSDCSLFHGVVTGYFYQLVGVDEWNKHVRKSGQILGFTNTKKQFDDLVPYSQYVMYVYLTVEGDRYNPDHYLKMEKATLAGDPNKPRQLEVISAYKQTFHLMWRPPYPPTGRVSSYTIRWKEPSAPDWLDYSSVPPASALCRDDINSNNICHNVNNLPKDRYIFQVQAINEGVDQASPWDQTSWDKEEINKRLHEDIGHIEDTTWTGIAITQLGGITENDVNALTKNVSTEKQSATEIQSQAASIEKGATSSLDLIEDPTNQRQPRILATNNTTLFTLIKTPKDNNVNTSLAILTEKDKMLKLSKSIISMQTVFIAVVSVILGILLVFLIYLSIRCRNKSVEPPPSRQSSMRTCSTTAGSQCSDTEIYRSGRTRDFVHLTRRYTQDPLPPVPDEHIYSDLRPKKENVENDLEEFIYLPPKPVLLDGRASDDDDEYLKTNFHTYKRIDTSASIERDLDPPIPIRSYESKDVFASKLNLSEHLCTIT